MRETMELPMTIEEPGNGPRSSPPPGSAGRRPSPKQARILAALNESDEITLADAVGLIGGNLYCNAEKHVGVTLSGMVKRGMIERVKPGVFRLPNNEPSR